MHLTYHNRARFCFVGTRRTVMTGNGEQQETSLFDWAIAAREDLVPAYVDKQNSQSKQASNNCSNEEPAVIEAAEAGRPFRSSFHRLLPPSAGEL